MRRWQLITAVAAIGLVACGGSSASSPSSPAAESFPPGSFAPVASSSPVTGGRLTGNLKLSATSHVDTTAPEVKSLDFPQSNSSNSSVNANATSFSLDLETATAPGSSNGGTLSLTAGGEPIPGAVYHDSVAPVFLKIHAIWFGHFYKSPNTGPGACMVQFSQLDSKGIKVDITCTTAGDFQMTFTATITAMVA